MTPGTNGRSQPHGTADESAPPPEAQLDLAVAPVSSALRADVGRFNEFLRQIRSSYLKSGLLLMVATVITGTLVTFTSGFSDWYMHFAMYLVLTAFGLLYLRAHLRRFRILEVLWLVLYGALLGFFSWILIDLIPARLDVLSNRLRPDGLIAPELGLRAEAPLLWLPVTLVWLQIAWLVLHAFLVGRTRRARA